MKKLTALTLALLMMISFSACGGNPKSDDETAVSKQSSETTEASEESTTLETPKMPDIKTQPFELSEFPVCNGDSKYFVPDTDDYILSMIKSSSGFGDVTYEYTEVCLESLDAEGKVVQFIRRESHKDEVNANAMFQNVLTYSDDAAVSGFEIDSVAKAGRDLYYKYSPTDHSMPKKQDLLTAMSYMTPEQIEDARSGEQVKYWISKP